MSCTDVRRIATGIVALWLIAACGGETIGAEGNSTLVSPEPESVDIDAVTEQANAYMRDVLHDDPADYQIYVHDDGDMWIISYRPPPDTVGARPLAIVLKETNEVLWFYDGGQ